MFVAAALLGAPDPAEGQGVLMLANPHWNITLTDAGYSDFLLDNTPGFEGREYLSGEWGAAVGYQLADGTVVSPLWFERNFVFPDWVTDSNFGVKSPLVQTGLNVDNLPIAQSVITNSHLEITLRHEMLDTVVGTPMGTVRASAGGPGTAIISSRYVLKQTCTIKNVSGGAMSRVQLFQFLHGLNSQHGVYDSRAYSGSLSNFHYDVTLAGVDPYATGTNSSTAGLEDYLGFQASVAPDAFEIGHYGIEGNGLDDHSIGKPSDGVHLSVESNWLTLPYSTRLGTDEFIPAQRWVSGAERWMLGALAAGQSVSLDLILSLRTGTRVATGAGSSGGSNGGSGVPGGVDYSFDDVTGSGSCFAGYSKADETEIATRVAHGEFEPFTFMTPGGPAQIWEVSFTGTNSGAIHLTFAYDPTILPSGLDQSTLCIYHFQGNAWEKLAGTVDLVRHTIAVTTVSLSAFALGVSGGTVYTVSASASPVSGGAVTGGGSFASGASVTLKATAGPGYVFTNWTEGALVASSSPTYTFIAQASQTLAANFVSAGGNVTITTSSQPADGGSTQGDGAYAAGTSATVVATANAGYKFSKWTVNSVTVGSSRTNTFTVTTNRVMVANFKPVYTVVVSADPPAGGDVEADSSKYEPGELAKMRARPQKGWCFVHWTQNGVPVSTDPDFQFNVTANRTLVGHFAFGNMITATPYPANGGTAGGGGVYGVGNSVTLTASAKPGYAFLNWTDNGVEVSQSESYTFDCVGNQVLVANFIASANPGFTVSVSASPSDGGTLSGGGFYTNGAAATVIAAPNSGFGFLNWSEGGVEVSALSAYSFTVVSNRALVANFVTNAPPFAFGGEFFQVAGQSLAINIADLMWSDYDPDGDPVSFAGVDATTSSGLALATNASQILIPASTVADGFTYTISDSYGATATAAATISIITNVTSRAMALDRLPDGTSSVSFAGVPWYWYEAQRATNAAFTGTLQAWPVQAWFDGSIYLWDDFTDLTNKPPQGFYRLRYNP